MKNENIAGLERMLKDDLLEDDKATRVRVREAVKEFLLDEASLIAKDRRHPVRDLAEINELILLNARVALLRLLIENPKAIPAKDVREILKDAESEKTPKDLDRKVDPVALVESLNVGDQQKADILQAMADALAAQYKPKRVGRGA